MQHDVTRLLEVTGVPFAVIAHLATGELVSVGDSRAVAGDDLFNSLFLDFECVSALNRSLQGQLLPRTWSQGKVSCIVCKPEEDVIVGLFSLNERDPVAQYHWTKKLGNEVTAFWQGR